VAHAPRRCWSGRAGARAAERLRQAEAARDEAAARAAVLQQRLDLAQGGAGAGPPGGDALRFVRQAAAARDEAELRAAVLQQRLDLAGAAGAPAAAAGSVPERSRQAAPDCDGVRAPGQAPSATEPCGGAPAAAQAPQREPALPRARPGHPDPGPKEDPAASGERPQPTRPARTPPRSVAGAGAPARCSSPTLGSLQRLVAGTEALVAQGLTAEGLGSGRRTPRRADPSSAGSALHAAPLARRGGLGIGQGGGAGVRQAASPCAAQGGAHVGTHVSALHAEPREAPPRRLSPQAPAPAGRPPHMRSPLAEVPPDRQLGAGRPADPARPMPSPKPAAAGGRRGAPAPHAIKSPAAKAGRALSGRTDPGAAPERATPAQARRGAGAAGRAAGPDPSENPGEDAGTSGNAAGGHAAMPEVEASLCLHGSPSSPLGDQEAAAPAAAPGAAASLQRAGTSSDREMPGWLGRTVMTCCIASHTREVPFRKGLP